MYNPGQGVSAADEKTLSLQRFKGGGRKHIATRGTFEKATEANVTETARLEEEESPLYMPENFTRFVEFKEWFEL